MTLTSLDYKVITPYLFLSVWACVLLLVDLFIPKDRKGIITAPFSIIAYLHSDIAVTLRDGIPQFGFVNGSVSDLYQIGRAHV